MLHYQVPMQLQNTRGREDVDVPVVFCEGLLSKSMAPALHTRKMTETFRALLGQECQSVQLNIDWNPGISVEEYVSEAARPLLEIGGRVPTIVTHLDPACHLDEIRSILDIRPHLSNQGTILVRLLLRSHASISAFVQLLFERVAEANEDPAFWPLVQGDALTHHDWAVLKDQSGSLWEHVYIAMSHHTDERTLRIIQDRVAVAQVAIGMAKDMAQDGTIALAPGMVVHGQYNLFAYIEKIMKLESTPQIVVMGPSLEGWNDMDNMRRIKRFLEISGLIKPQLLRSTA